MADPRGACPPNISRENRIQSRKKGFFDAIKTVGGLEALNEVGYGDVRRGLETLGRVSDSVRSGKSVVPGSEGDEIFNSTLGSIASTAADSVDEGANIVLDSVGIGRGVLTQVGEIDQAVANRGYEAAVQVYDRVKAGNFQLEDIPSVFSDLQNVEILGRSIFFPTTIEDSQINELSKSLCLPSPFAIDLVAHAPRFKFMYVVDIKFNPAYSAWNENLSSGVAFVTKSTTRPQVDFEYDEVNMYNYWTQVIKRTRFNPMSMRFIDDQVNNFSMIFYAAYMRAVSPITNRKFVNTGSGGGIHSTVGTYESNSMDFDNTNDDPTIEGVVLPSYSASVGVPNTDDNGLEVAGLLSNITLYHIGNYGSTVTAFHMFNPRITSLQPDELNMADNGDGSEFMFEFNYDSLYVDPAVPIEEFGIETMATKTGDGVRSQYPLIITTGSSSDGTTSQPPSNPGIGNPRAGF